MESVRWRELIPVVVVAPVLVCQLSSDLLAQQQTFEGGTAVTLVEVPVTVIHDGEPIEGLTVEDFELFDRGERQEIRTFERIVIDPATEPETVRGVLTPRARAARRNFLFFFDLAFADARRLGSATESLERLLTESLSPSDRVGVAFFSALHGFQWIVGLTDSHEDAATALGVLRAVIDSDARRAEEILAEWSPGGDLWPAGARPDPQAIVAEAGVSGFNRSGGGSWPVASILRFLVRGLTDAVEETAALDGRKYLVQLSYGLPDYFVTGRSGERARVLRQLQEIKRACRTAGWAIHSVNLAGLGWGRESLFTLAADTGGQLFTNSNDVTLLVQEMESTTRVTYVLGFQPEDLEPDGRYHKLEVRLQDGPRGARIIHRPGYYAPSEE